ncbi:MAG: helix-turn-helix transcriptional regulator [Erysipelotrichaceae bacterium]|nr:helix-turn-helix transcriptional regulator [Erysipelotrichaceae bacterium]
MRFEEKLVQLRKQRGLSQEELAYQLDVSRQAISRWETGSVYPDAPHLLKLSKLFEVSIDYLLHDEYRSSDDLPQVQNKVRQIKEKEEKQARSYLIGAYLWAFAGCCFLFSAVMATYFNPLIYVNIVLDIVLAIRNYQQYKKLKHQK